MLVFHDENGTGLAIVSGVEDEIIRAEVKHNGHLDLGTRSCLRPRPIRSADEGLSRRTPPVLGVSSQSGA
jgi:hypothetical protein